MSEDGWCACTSRYGITPGCPVHDRRDHIAELKEEIEELRAAGFGPPTLPQDRLQTAPDPTASDRGVGEAALAVTSAADASLWRVGRKVGRTIYLQLGPQPSDDDPLIGVMDTPELAAEVVALRRRAAFLETALQEIESVPSEHDLLYNAVARAMLTIARSVRSMSG